MAVSSHLSHVTCSVNTWQDERHNNLGDDWFSFPLYLPSAYRKHNTEGPLFHLAYFPSPLSSLTIVFSLFPLSLCFSSTLLLFSIFLFLLIFFLRLFPPFLSYNCVSSILPFPLFFIHFFSLSSLSCFLYYFFFLQFCFISSILTFFFIFLLLPLSFLLLFSYSLFFYFFLHYNYFPFSFYISYINFFFSTFSQ